MYRGLPLVFQRIPHQEVNHVDAKTYDDGEAHDHIPGKPLASEEHTEEVMAEGKGDNGGSEGQEVVHGHVLFKQVEEPD